MRQTRPLLRLVVPSFKAPEVPPPTPPATSRINLEIGPSGALQKLEVELRPEDALQAMNGLLMAHMRALALLHH